MTKGGLRGGLSTKLSPQGKGQSTDTPTVHISAQVHKGPIVLRLRQQNHLYYEVHYSQVGKKRIFEKILFLFLC